jgi:4-hydroxyphenylacetate 3-monooxygenase
MLRNGNQYLESLANRQLSLAVGSERSSNLRHPALVSQARQIARYFDFQSQSPLTSRDAGGGERVALAHHAPRTHDELREKASALSALAQSYEGFLGRAPDYMAVWLSAYGAAAGHFGAYRENMARFTERVAREDLFVSHTTTPLRRLNGSVNELHVTRCADGSVRVRGTRAMATSGPLSDELLILPQPPGGLKAVSTLVASLPVDSAGLHFVSREPFPGRSRLGSGYEETDSIVIFQDVVIPKESIYVLSDDATHAWRAVASGAAHISMQTNARAIAKMESVIGLARYAGRNYGLESNDEFKSVVGRALRDLAMLSACQTSALEQSAPDRVGVWTPALLPLDAARTFFMEVYPRVVGQLRHVLSSELYHLFSPSALEAEVNESLFRDWGLEGNSLEERQRLTATLHDLLLSDFGMRHELYEAHYLGSERRNTIRIWEAHRERVAPWDDGKVQGLP